MKIKPEWRDAVANALDDMPDHHWGETDEVATTALRAAAGMIWLAALEERRGEQASREPERVLNDILNIFRTPIPDPAGLGRKLVSYDRGTMEWVFGEILGHLTAYSSRYQNLCPMSELDGAMERIRTASLKSAAHHMNQIYGEPDE